jgi:hypothetical protein
MELPDFLQLEPEAVEAEKRRQTRLKQEFNTRARQTPAELEAARALIIEDSLRAALKADHAPNEKSRIADQLAENLAQQGRFNEAAGLAEDEHAQAFYAKAADAIFNRQMCDCPARIEMVVGQRIQLPKFRVIKQVYSLKAASFGYLLECDRCAEWCFSTSNPLPAENLTLDGPNDLEKLKI